MQLRAPQGGSSSCLLRKLRGQGLLGVTTFFKGMFGKGMLACVHRQLVQY
jgi:hypothetical protein